jgi:hypothetical protein
MRPPRLIRRAVPGVGGARKSKLAALRPARHPDRLGEGRPPNVPTA